MIGSVAERSAIAERSGLAGERLRDLSDYLGHTDEGETLRSARLEHNQEVGFTLDDWKACPPGGRRGEDPRKTEALIRAAAAGKVNAVAELLEHGARTWHCDANGGTALHFAAYYNHPNVASVLFQHHADPNAKEHHGTRAAPIHVAAMNGHEAIIRILMHHHVHSIAKDASGCTALQIAEVRGHTSTADLIRRHIYFAAAYGQLDIVRLLLDHGADPQTCESTSSASTCLHAAAMNGNWEIVEELIEAGADPFAKDGAFRTALDVARDRLRRAGVGLPLMHQDVQCCRVPDLRGHWIVAKLLQRFVLDDETGPGKPSPGVWSQYGAVGEATLAGDACKVFFELADNAIIFDKAGLGPINDPRLLVVFMYELVTELMDVNGFNQRFDFGTWSAAGTRVLVEELMRLSAAIVTAGHAYTRVLIISPTSSGRLPPDSWTQSLKKIVNAEPDASPLRAFHIALRGALPKAKLSLFNSSADPATGQPRFPQLKLCVQ